MPGQLFHISPELLQWAIKRSGLSTEKLRKKFPKIDDWKTGDRQPTPRQLEDFARITMVPLGVLFLGEPPVEEIPLPDFRTQGDRPLQRFSPNLIDTIHTIQQRQDWLKEMAKREGLPDLKFVGSIGVGQNVQAAAQQIRQQLNLDADWSESVSGVEAAIKTLRRAAERIGISIFSNGVVGMNNTRSLDPEEFRGFVLCDNQVPVVFLNDRDTTSGKIFTLAHELVHVWINESGVFNLDRFMPSTAETERFCNQVAAEFLVPEYKLLEAWDSSDRHSFRRLSKTFKVSALVIARRALDLALVSPDEFFSFYRKERERWQQVKDQRPSGGGNFYTTQANRLGHRFSAAIVRAAREGRLLYRDAFRLTGMNGRTFHTFADAVEKKVMNERES